MSNTLLVKELIKIADQVIDQDSLSEEGVELIEQYITKFSTWYEDYQANPTSVDASQLEALSVNHTAVLTKAKEWKLNTQEGLSQTRKKGKGLKAYIDHLPKRISLRRSKRG